MKIENTQILLFFISINQKKMSYLQKSNPKIKVNKIKKVRALKAAIYPLIFSLFLFKCLLFVA